jgi:hypothetical protein
MKDPYDEGAATHIGLDSCVYIRKGIDEALPGGVRAGLLSRERCRKLQDADAAPKVEGNTGCIDIERYGRVLRAQRPREGIKAQLRSATFMNEAQP